MVAYRCSYPTLLMELGKYGLMMSCALEPKRHWSAALEIILELPTALILKMLEFAAVSVANIIEKPMIHFAKLKICLTSYQLNNYLSY